MIQHQVVKPLYCFVIEIIFALKLSARLNL